MDRLLVTNCQVDTTYRQSFTTNLTDEYDEVHESAKEGDCTPLMGACMQGHVHVTNQLLCAKAEVNARNTIGSAALHYAAKRGSLACVQALVEAGADLEIRDRYSSTPLLDAVIERNVEIVRFLAQHGANTNYVRPIQLVNSVMLNTNPMVKIVRKVRVVENYRPYDGKELLLRKDEIVVVIEALSVNRWRGSVRGRIGLFSTGRVEAVERLRESMPEMQVKHVQHTSK